jgi:hypothetical protein
MFDDFDMVLVFPGSTTVVAPGQWLVSTSGPTSTPDYGRVVLVDLDNQAVCVSWFGCQVTQLVRISGLAGDTVYPEGSALLALQDLMSRSLMRASVQT